MKEHVREGAWALPLAVAALAYATALAIGPSLLDDPDPYSHIAVGRWIINHRALPPHDVFSHSIAGAPWVLHEWLAEVASALLHRAFGWAGLMAAAALCFAAAMGLLMHGLLRWLSPTAALIGVASAWAMAFPHLLARPHVASWPLLVLWTGVLARAGSEQRAPALWWTLLLVPWANLHGSHLLGLLLALMFAGEALFDATDRRAFVVQARQWVLFVMLSVIASLITPLGFDGLLYPFHHMQLDYVRSWIHEWQSPNFQELQPLEAWLLLLLLGALFLGLRLPITRIAMLLFFIHLALVHQRHGVVLGLVTPLLVAPALAPQLPPLPHPSRGLRNAGLAGMLALAVAASAWALPRARVPAYLHPEAAIAAARQAGAHGPVLNDYNFGGYLMFIGEAPFIDGRLDVYGDAFLRRFHDTAALPDLLEQYRIGWTLLSPRSRHLPLLDRLPGWRRVHADELAVVHVRR